MCSCMTELQTAVDNNNASIHKRYLALSAGEHGIRNMGGEKDNSAIFLAADSDKAVILFHGFMASPPEMEGLGRYLHEQLGCNVYIPIIPGFASDHSMSRHYNFEDWRNCITDSIDLMSLACHDISLVGYSIGGGIVVDYLMGGEVSSKVTSVSLLSPFLKGANWQLPFFGTVAAKIVLSLLAGRSRLRGITLHKINKISGGLYTDLPTLLEDADTYSQSFTFESAIKLMDLFAAIKRIETDDANALPVFFAYTECDKTINWRYAQRYIAKHFNHVQDTFVIPKELAVPHEIIVNKLSVNPDARALYKKVADFIRKV